MLPTVGHDDPDVPPQVSHREVHGLIYGDDAGMAHDE
jgi:hypothetical protein